MKSRCWKHAVARCCLALIAICLFLIGCRPNSPEPPPTVPPMVPVSQVPPETGLPNPVTPDEPPLVTSTDTPPPPVASTPTPPKAVDIEELIKQMTSDERQAAAVSLATAGKAAVPALIKALEHADWQVRAAAVFALGQIGPDAVDAKTRLQAISEKDENTSVRDAAAFALDAIAEGARK